MKYLIIVNDDERLANGDDPGLDETKYEIEESLRSAFFEVESIERL
jgi:hypothetical protein